MILKNITKTVAALASLVASTSLYTSAASEVKKPAISYVQYACEQEASFFSVNSLDYRADNQTLPASKNLFLNSSHKEKQIEHIRVSECMAGDKLLSLTRVYLNKPDDSGSPCATLDWAVFQLKADDKVISEFISGCSLDIHVFTNEFNLNVCKSDFNYTVCKTTPWRDINKENFKPIRVGLFGDWL